MNKRGGGGSAAVSAVVVFSALAMAALLLAPVRAGAVTGLEAGFAIRPGWPQLTADPNTGAQMNVPIEGSIGRSGWFKHSSPTLADLNGDGSKEIVVGSLDGRVYVYFANGSAYPGLWPRRLDAPSTPAGPINGTPAVGDLDGDGRPEIVIGDDNGWVFAFNADGTIKPGWPQFSGYNADYPAGCVVNACTGVVASPTLADLDSDGRMEVIVGSYSHKMWVWRGSGSVVPGWPRDVWDGIASTAAVGDLDRDGSPDIVVGSDVANDCANCPPYGHLSPGGLVHAFRTDGSELPGWPQATDSFMSSSPALADLDLDGSLEVVIGGGFFTSGQTTRGHHLYAFRAGGSLMWRFDDPTPTGIFLGSPAVANVTGDARPEVAIGDYAGVIHLIGPNGAVLWARSFTLLTTNGAYFGGPVLADLTGDGQPEVVAADANWHVKAWNAAGDFVGDSSQLTAVTRYSMWNSPAVADLDGNGRNEVVLASANGDGPAGDIQVAAGRGSLWVLNTNGTGAGPWPQFQSRVLPGRYRLYTGATASCPSPQAPATDLPAVFRDGAWYMRNSYTTGGGDSCVVFGQSGDIAVTGDWNRDGSSTIGIFRPSEGRWYLTNNNASGVAEGVFRFGSPGDIPVVGDWNRDGTDTIGVFRPAEGRWYLSNFFDRGSAEGVFSLGSPGDLPVVGDWNRDGTDTIGVFRPSEGRWYISNYFNLGFAEGVVQFGSPGDRPVVGDWNHDGFDSLGVFRAGNWYISNSFLTGIADGSFRFGQAGDQPVVWG